MIPFADMTITLYNKYYGQDNNGRTVVTWYRRVLDGCFWKETFKRAILGETELKAHDIVCKIPVNLDYQPYIEWAASDRTAHFTLSADDIIVLGAVTDELGTGISVAELLEKYRRSGVMTVKSASDNSAYPLPHYIARGE